MDHYHWYAFDIPVRNHVLHIHLIDGYVAAAEKPTYGGCVFDDVLAAYEKAAACFQHQHALGGLEI